MTNFEVGDRACIVGPKKGTNDHWSEIYDRFIGKVGPVVEVENINYARISIDGMALWFHSSTLELEDEYGE